MQAMSGSKFMNRLRKHMLYILEQFHFRSVFGSEIQSSHIVHSPTLQLQLSRYRQSRLALWPSAPFLLQFSFQNCCRCLWSELLSRKIRNEWNITIAENSGGNSQSSRRELEAEFLLHSLRPRVMTQRYGGIAAGHSVQDQDAVKVWEISWLKEGPLRCTLKRGQMILLSC